MTEADVRNTFGEFGEVTSVVFNEKPGGRFRGSALVYFSDTESTDKVIQRAEEEGLYVGNKEVRVSYAHPDVAQASINLAPKPSFLDLSEKPPGCLTVFLGMFYYHPA